MKRKLALILFIIGLIFATLLNVVTWFEWPGVNFNFAFFASIFYCTFLIVLLLAIIGIVSRGKERWLSVLMASVVFLGFSLSYLYSLGYILAPIAIVLVIVSIKKLEKAVTLRTEN